VINTVRLVVSSGMTLAVLSCASPSEPVAVDSRYSEYLSVTSREYEAAARVTPATTVKVVQIFSPGGNDTVSLRNSTRGRLVYETRAPGDIAAILDAIRSQEAPGSCDLSGDPAFVLVAYDRDLPRVGLIRLYKCEAQVGAVVGVRPAGDAAITYSSSGVAYLQRIGIW
jgi:hypothetical protein